MTVNRREIFAALMAAAAARGILGAEDDVTVAGKRPLILQNDWPEDLETPVSDFESWLTPTDVFFVRQHLPRPAPIDPAAYRLAVNGLVSKPLSLALADLQKLAQQTIPATLECAGNGRAFFRPQVPGVQWSRGAIGNAEWSGPRVSDVLALAGADRSAAFLEIDGADIPVGGAPDFVRSMPMKKAMDPSTILALRMNGQPIPDIHGFPARLIVPGWCGSSFVKWVTRLFPRAVRRPRPIWSRSKACPLSRRLPHRKTRLRLRSARWSFAVLHGPERSPSSASRCPPMAAAAGAKQNSRRRNCALPGGFGSLAGSQPILVTTRSCRARPIRRDESSRSCQSGIPRVTFIMLSIAWA